MDPKTHVRMGWKAGVRMLLTLRGSSRVVVGEAWNALQWMRLYGFEDARVQGLWAARVWSGRGWDWQRGPEKLRRRVAGQL